MLENFYNLIQLENEKKYGTDVSRYGKTLLANLYSDRTHFIYEILQNTEDAYERARNEGLKIVGKIQFILYPDRLEIRHNGIPFTESDVRGVCGIVEGTKNDDAAQIGKFGIGFKSVYAFTKSPQIFSDKYTFEIKNYVHPHARSPRDDMQIGETLIVIPFNGDQIKSEEAFIEIENRLKDLDIRTPLFLKNILEISWVIGETIGLYKKEIQIEDSAKLIKLCYSENKKLILAEKWIIFSKPLTVQPKINIEIAFKIKKEDKTNKNHINPISDSFAVAYFPTRVKTNLHFLIQAPFHTTPARDNIRDDDEWNKYLINELGIFTADTIIDIKKKGLLDYQFLNTLPIEKWRFDQSNFHPFFQSVKEKLLGDEAFLPTFNNDFTTAKNGLLARGEKLRELLHSDQLCILFNREHAIWLDENITSDRTPDLKKYITEELGVREIGGEQFALSVDGNFLRNQSDSWITLFYEFLNDQEALWRKKLYNQEEGILRKKPIIRLTDDKHINPFTTNGEPQAYLPSKFEDHFLTVKKATTKTEKAKDFLKKLGLHEPDQIDGLNKILPRYSEIEPGQISEEENLSHVEWITKTFKQISDGTLKIEYSRKNDLEQKIRTTSFLCSKNPTTSESAYKRPSEVHLGKNYSKNNDIDVFFEGDADIWYLDEKYLARKNIDSNVFEILGCKKQITVNYSKRLDPYGNAILEDRPYYSHKRGLNGFDPDCEIEGLEFALKRIAPAKSKIIWNLLKQHYDRISGTVESSKRKDFSHPTPSFHYSKMGSLLILHEWLPNKDGVFRKPSDIQLSELPDDFDPNSVVSGRIADRLNLKKSYQSNCEVTPGDKETKEIIDILKILSADNRKKILESLQKMLPNTKKDSPSPSEILGNFKDNLVKDGPSSVEPDDPRKPDITPEEEEMIRQNYGEGLLKRLKQLKILHEIKIQQKNRIIDSINPKTFLLDQYDGHCQVCYTKLDLGPNRVPYFTIYRLFKFNNEVVWANTECNVLCLCPNCHALMNHAIPLNLQNIFITAEKIKSREIAPEEIPERNGNYYIVKIIVAGKEKNLYYSPTHMQKVSAFLENTKEK